ncbi:MAG: NADH-quinone oxidoreductase subunit C, partial [Desulfomonile tiedjei]|nr:NADH-quinone oxidoreductase subunit C [Desulfomonile tiedjei]
MDFSGSALQELADRFGEDSFTSQPTRDDVPTLWVPEAKLPAVLRFLKSEISGPYRMLYDLTAIDERVRNNRTGQPDASFSLVYHLLSFDRNEDLRLKVALNGELPSTQSITDIWPAANWYEREIWDMFGVTFVGHPNLRRLLMPPTWQGHPLRKEHPARATEMGIFELPEEKAQEEELAAQFRPEEWGMKSDSEESDLMFLNMGPQHPST